MYHNLCTCTGTCKPISSYVCTLSTAFHFCIFKLILNRFIFRGGNNKATFWKKINQIFDKANRILNVALI